MGKPKTLLEGLCGHAVSLGADSIAVEHREGREWVFAKAEGTSVRIAAYPVSGSDAKELQRDLAAAAKKPVRTVIAGQLSILTVRRSDRDDVLDVTIEPVAAPDPSVAPRFTTKQGQYLAFIYHYSKIHRQAPAEGDLERYFRVSSAAIHGMIQTLERNGLIRRTPGQARSIQLQVSPQHLPSLK
jgi:hypothetical protein